MEVLIISLILNAIFILYFGYQLFLYIFGKTAYQRLENEHCQKMSHRILKDWQKDMIYIKALLLSD